MNLLKILERAQKRKDQLNFKDAWAETFGLPKTDDVLVQVNKHLVGLHWLLERIIELVGRIPDQGSEVHAAPLHKLRNLFSPMSYGGTWGAFKRDYLTADVFYALSVCDQQFRTRLYLSEQLIPANDLNELSKKVSDLFDDVKASDVESDLKNYMLKMLEAIRQGIAQYEISGAEGLTDKLAQIIGHMHLYKSKEPQAKTPANDQARGFMRKFQTLLVMFVSVVAIANTAVDESKELSKNIIGLLPAYCNEEQVPSEGTSAEFAVLSDVNAASSQEGDQNSDGIIDAEIE